MPSGNVPVRAQAVPSSSAPAPARAAAPSGKNRDEKLLLIIDGIKGSIPAVFKRTYEEQNSGKAVFKQLPSVIGDFWTTEKQPSAEVQERRRKILETIPTTGPFQKVLVASKELEPEKDDFDFDQNESRE